MGDFIKEWQKCEMQFFWGILLYRESPLKIFYGLSIFLLFFQYFFRENLITKLQEEAREKYLAELNLIAQKIRSIPLPSTAEKSVS